MLTSCILSQLQASVTLASLRLLLVIVLELYSISCFLTWFCYSSLWWGPSGLPCLLLELLWVHENLLTERKEGAQWLRDYTGTDDGDAFCSKQLFCSWIKAHAVLLVSLSKALSSPCGKLFCLHCFTLCCSARSLPHFSFLFPLPFKQHLSVFPIQICLCSVPCVKLPCPPYHSSPFAHSPPCLSLSIHLGFLSARLGCPLLLPLLQSSFCVFALPSLWLSEAQQSAVCSLRMLC